MKANNKFGFKEAKEQIDISSYLASLGYHPKKEMGNDSWYLSPFHEEHTPSFKVDRKHKIWYDHSIGFGGDLVDFVLKYHQCSYGEALQKLKDFLPVTPQGNTERQTTPVNKTIGDATTGKKIHIVAERPIFKYYLKSYLNERCIPFELAAQYLKEVDFTNDSGEAGKVYTALGFKNNEGGYELRSKNFKAASAPKAPTLLTNMTIGEAAKKPKHEQTLAVFEGFFSFLSFLKLQHQHQLETPLPDNFLVLNSLAFFLKSLDVMDSYGKKHLCLDNDAAGRAATAEALAHGTSYEDYSHTYAGSNDLNRYLVQLERPGMEASRAISRRH